MSRVNFTRMSSTPTAPAAGKNEVFVDNADGRFKQVSDTGMVCALSDLGFRNKNLLSNGGFDFAQRQAPGSLVTYSNTSGRSYGADRWGMTNENASIQYQRIDSIAAPESDLSARMYGKFKKITNAGKMVITQVLEANDIAHLRGRTVRVQMKMRYTVAASMVVRLGLLQLTSAGTTDTMPATFVAAFGAVGTDPTWGTNIAAIVPSSAVGGVINGNAVDCTLTGSWVNYSATFVVPTNCKNLVVAVWTNGQPAGNDELNIAEAGLYEGCEIRDWFPFAHAVELERCQRYYCKTFPVDTAPAQSGGVGGSLRFVAGKAGAAAEYGQFRFPVTMRITPATLTSYNPAAANAQVRDSTVGVDCSAAAFSNSSDSMTDISATGNATTAVGSALDVHITADAEL